MRGLDQQYMHSLSSVIQRNDSQHGKSMNRSRSIRSSFRCYLVVITRFHRRGSRYEGNSYAVRNRATKGAEEKISLRWQLCRIGKVHPIFRWRGLFSRATGAKPLRLASSFIIAVSDVRAVRYAHTFYASMSLFARGDAMLCYAPWHSS